MNLADDDDQQDDRIAASSASSSYRPHPHSRTQSSPYSTKISTGSGMSSQNALPFYFAILVIVVFSVCIYALVQLRCSEVLITGGRSLESGCNSSGSSATGHLISQSDHQSKHQLMMEGCSPGGAVSHFLPTQVVTSIHTPYYHGYSHQAYQQAYNRQFNNNLAYYQDNQTKEWNVANNHQQTQQAPSSFSTVMHLYTASGQQQDVVSRGHHHHPKFSARPTYKAYYELLFAPEDTREESEVNEKEELIDSTANSQQLPKCVIDSLVEKLANDTVSWKMLARQLGMSILRPHTNQN